MKTPLLRAVALLSVLLTFCLTASLRASAEGDDLRAADAELNAVYQKALNAMPSADAKDKLREAQRAWVAFRDAELALNATLPGASGNTLKMLQTGLTGTRTKQLRLLAKGELSDASGQ